MFWKTGPMKDVQRSWTMSSCDEWLSQKHIQIITLCCRHVVRNQRREWPDSRFGCFLRLWLRALAAMFFWCRIATQFRWRDWRLRVLLRLKKRTNSSLHGTAVSDVRVHIVGWRWDTSTKELTLGSHSLLVTGSRQFVKILPMSLMMFDESKMWMK